jgi:hypothetical protein
MDRGYHPRVRRISIVLAVASVVAIATTRGSVHVAPDRLVLVAAAAALTAALLVPERRHRAAAVASALVAGAAAAHVLVRPGMPQVHDLDHVWGLWAYARAVRSGDLLPMWIPWLGAGMPLLRFYGPVSFLTALPGIVLGLSPVAVWKLALVQASVLAAVTTLAGSRLLGASWRGAAIAACALAFAPWKLAVFDYRGALGEAVAFVAAPLVAAAVIGMWRAPSRRLAWWLGAAVALLVPTHLITFFCLGVVLVPVLVLETIAARTPALRRAGQLAIPVVLAVAAVAAWAVPALAESGATSLPLQLRENPYLVYAQHGLTPQDVAERRAWDRSRASLPRNQRAAGAEGLQMPFYVGSVLLIAGMSAPWWSRSRATWGPACGAAVAVLLAMAPVADVTTRLPLVDAVQFPWRFLSTAVVLASLSLGVGVTALLERGLTWRAALPVLALPALLVADAAPYTGASGWIPPYRGITHWALNPGADPGAPFDVAWHAVPVELEAGSEMVRVGGLQLPPGTTETPVELLWLAYVEWTTPPFYRGLLATRRPEEFGEAAVRWFFVPERDDPIAIPAKPYATIVAGGAEIDAGAFTRSPGHVTLRPRAPDGGARLLVREQAFPGWRAHVDGQETAIGTGTLGFMTIELPAGEHEVVLDHTGRTPARIAGSLISLVTLVGLGVRPLFRRGKGV